MLDLVSSLESTEHSLRIHYCQIIWVRHILCNLMRSGLGTLFGMYRARP